MGFQEFERADKTGNVRHGFWVNAFYFAHDLLQLNKNIQNASHKNKGSLFPNSMLILPCFTSPARYSILTTKLECISNMSCHFREMGTFVTTNGLTMIKASTSFLNIKLQTRMILYKITSSYII
jgi:hypothetical protein